MFLYINRYFEKKNIVLEPKRKKEESSTFTFLVSLSMMKMGQTLYTQCTFNFTRLFYVWKFLKTIP